MQPYSLRRVVKCYTSSPSVGEVAVSTLVRLLDELETGVKLSNDAFPIDHLHNDFFTALIVKCNDKKLTNSVLMLFSGEK